MSEVHQPPASENQSEDSTERATRVEPASAPGHTGVTTQPAGDYPYPRYPGASAPDDGNRAGGSGWPGGGAGTGWPGGSGDSGAQGRPGGPWQPDAGRAGAGYPGNAGHPGTWPGGSWQGGSWQGGSWQGGSWQPAPWPGGGAGAGEAGDWPTGAGGPGGQPPWWPPQGGPYWQPGPPPRQRHTVRNVLIGAAVVVLLICAGVASLGFVVYNGLSRNNAGSSSGLPAAPSPGTPLNLSQVAAKVDPGLVDINTVLGLDSARAAGTGMVLNSSGLVLTNNHVVTGATSISVTDIGNGQTYSATVVGYDRSDDVAVIQLTNASGLQTVTIGDSSKVRLGDAVAGIGNAGGTGGTPSISAGTVTALNQSITASDQATGSTEQLTGMIQVNANVQPGDSGGPLVNSDAQVIGMDTAASGNFSFQQNTGQGFAIPINKAMSIGRQIAAHKASGNVHIGPTAFLGVEVSASTSQTTPGAAIAGVVPNSPASGTALTGGDIIVSVGGHAVSSPNALTKVMDGYHPGDRVAVTWLTQSGQRQSATVRLATGPVG